MNREVTKQPVDQHPDFASALLQVLQQEQLTVWHWDPVRDVMTSLHKVSKPLLPGRHDLPLAVWLEHMVSPDGDELKRIFGEILRTGTPATIEVQVRNYLGETRFMRTTLARVFRERGGNAGILGATLDLTEQYRLEREKSGLGLQLAASIEAAPYGVGIVDAGFICLALNDSGARLIGTLDREQLIGADVRASMDPALVKDYEAHVARVLAGATEVIELRMGGGRWLEVTASPLPGPDGVGQAVFSIFQDLSARKQLAEQVILATGQEQARIARDLHDGLGQELAGIALILEGLRARPPSSPKDLQEDLSEVLAMVRNTMGELRSIAAGLSPAALERGGLAGAARTMLDRLSSQDGLTVDSSVRLRAEPPPAVAGELFRILQEGVTNAIRHSRGTRIKVELAGDEQRVRLRVTDDGVGQVPDPDQSAGMGLKLMRYRSQLIGASLRLGPVAPRGTELSVTWSAGRHRTLA